VQVRGAIGGPEVVRVRSARRAEVRELGTASRGQIVFAHGVIRTVAPRRLLAGAPCTVNANTAPPRCAATRQASARRACRLFGHGIGVIAVITRIRPAHWMAARLVLLALAATFAAMTVSTVVRGRLSRVGVPVGSRAIEEVRTAATRPLTDYYGMTRRNLFAAVPATEPSGSAAPGATATSLRLVGTGRRGVERFAIVEDLAAKRQEVVRVGDPLGGGKVASIGWRRMVIERSSGNEVLTVAPDQAPPGADAARATAAATTTTAAAASDEQIRKIGEDRYLVAQAEVDHSLENLSELFTQLRAVPNVEGGQTNGFKVFAIRRGSLFQKIGLENNDVIQRVNGTDLNDPTRAMALFQELQGQTRLTVDVVRGGQPRTLTYEIR
jgi:general secretion pathway protein C